jgi:hypothetical protein
MADVGLAMAAPIRFAALTIIYMAEARRPVNSLE